LFPGVNFNLNNEAGIDPGGPRTALISWVISTLSLPSLPEVEISCSTFAGKGTPSTTACSDSLVTKLPLRPSKLEEINTGRKKPLSSSSITSSGNWAFIESGV